MAASRAQQPSPHNHYLFQQLREVVGMRSPLLTPKPYPESQAIMPPTGHMGPKFSGVQFVGRGWGLISGDGEERMG